MLLVGVSVTIKVENVGTKTGKNTYKIPLNRVVVLIN